MNSTLKTFIAGLPKAELHLHIEGSFEPELMFEIAERNGVEIPYQSIEEVKTAYKFNNLQEFLDIYYAGASVLLKAQDFYDLTWAYLTKVHAENVKHVEIFFDPQTHTERGVPFETVITGIHKALEQAKTEFGISFKLIMSYLRHLSEEKAFETLEEALPFKDWIHGVGLDSSELGNPPSKFKNVFEKSVAQGFLPVAHAGEEGPSEYIWEALDLLNIVRVDHGNRCLDDENLVQELVERKIPLTVCPTSNDALQVVKDMKSHPIQKMVDKGLLVTVNSDDPAYFGGYMNKNFEVITEHLNLSKQQIIKLAKNGFEGSWLTDGEKQKMFSEVDEYVKGFES